MAPALGCILFAAMLVLPLLHRLEHGLANARLEEAIARESGRVHADFPALSRALVNIAHDPQQCAVCTTLVYTVALASAEVPRDVRRELVLGVEYESLAVVTVSFQSTRAPPTRA